jgi:hypothetical protein
VAQALACERLSPLCSDNSYFEFFAQHFL